MSKKWLIKTIIYIVSVLVCGIGTILLVEFDKPLYALLFGTFSFYGGRALQMWCDTFDMEKVNGEFICTFDGKVRIIWGDKGKTLIFSGENGNDFVCLNDCLKLIGYDGNGTVVVIVDEAMSGKVYKYGNYGKYWHEYGRTLGVA